MIPRKKGSHCFQPQIVLILMFLLAHIQSQCICAVQSSCASEKSQINTSIYRYTPLSSRCRCCIWRSSTKRICSYTAKRVSTGVCCILDRNTSGHSCWAAELFCCKGAHAFQRCQSEGQPRSSWATSRCRQGPCPRAFGRSGVFWSLGRWGACCDWLVQVPRERRGCTCPWGCILAGETWGALSSRSWWCRSPTHRGICTPGACPSPRPTTWTESCGYFTWSKILSRLYPSFAMERVAPTRLPLSRDKGQWALKFHAVPYCLFVAVYP